MVLYFQKEEILNIDLIIKQNKFHTKKIFKKWKI